MSDGNVARTRTISTQITREILDAVVLQRRQSNASPPPPKVMAYDGECRIGLNSLRWTSTAVRIAASDDHRTVINVNTDK